MHPSQAIVLIVLGVSVAGQDPGCRPEGWSYKPYQDIMFAADIVIYGRDVSSIGECPPPQKACNYPHREHSHFRVFCVLKADGKPVPQNILIEPETYWEKCTATRFSNTENGWEYIVAIKRGENGKYHWDEVQPFQSAYHKAHPDVDVVLEQTTKMCGLQRPTLPVNRLVNNVKSCPSVTTTKDTCTKACPRGWLKESDSCYLISSVDDRQGRDEASIKCAGHYAHLLSINSLNERDSIGRWLVYYPQTEWWSSGKRVDGTFVWDDKAGGTPFSPEFRPQWRPTQPDNKGGDENYISVFYTKERYGWSDNKGSLSLPYICERELDFEPPRPDVCDASAKTEKLLEECLLSVRHGLSVSSSKYWFGDGFSARCAGNHDRNGIDCFKVGKVPSSLTERLFGLNNFAATTLKQLLHVSISSPSGTIFACNSEFQGTNQTSRLDPVKPPTVTSWHVRKGSALSMTWTPQDGKLYTLVIVDAGMMSMRGMWINVQKDDWKNGQVLKPYSGATSPFVSIDNPVVFLLYEQSAAISDVSDDVRNMLSNDVNKDDMYIMHRLSRELNLTGPVAMNMMLVKGDEYSAGYNFLPRNPTNLCHVYVQKAAMSLHNPLIKKNVKFSRIIEAHFTSPSLGISMCCKGFTLRPASQVINPIGNKLLPSHLVRSQPKLRIYPGGSQLWNSESEHKDHLYTLIMVEQSNKSTEVKVPLHWAIINFKINNESRIEEGETVVSYTEPLPTNNEVRTYTLLLYRQSDNINSSLISSHSATCKPRCTFDVEAFMTGGKLTLTSASWFRVTTDPYVVYSRIRNGHGGPVENCQMLWDDLNIIGDNVACVEPAKLTSASKHLSTDSFIVPILILAYGFVLR